MISVFDIANLILQNRNATTAWQLQKLCYYTKAWGLALDNNPVFAEPFEAWENGPVCRAMYYRHKGRKNVPRDFFSNYENSGYEEKTLVQAVLCKYGRMTGDELRDLSHSERPWKETRGDLPEGAKCDRKIEDALMRAFYSEDEEALEEMDNLMLAHLAAFRLEKGEETVSFQDMMQRFGIEPGELGDEDVDIEIEPIIL